jgi:hypothetical protein
MFVLDSATYQKCRAATRKLTAQMSLGSAKDHPESRIAKDGMGAYTFVT